MGGGSSRSQPTSTTTTVQNNEPAAWQKPILQKVGSEGLAKYNSGDLNFDPYPDSTVVPFSGQTQQAMGLLESLGQGGAQNIEAANDQVGNILNQGGISAGQQGQIDNMSRVAGGGYRPEQMAGVQGLMETASGGQLNGNPYLDQRFQSGAEAIGRSVNDSMGSAGRYGSGAHQATMADSIGDFHNQVYGQNYAQERQNQISAQGQLIGAGQSQDGLATSAAGNAFNAMNTGNQNIFQAAGMAPNLYTAQGLPSEFLMDVGNMNEDLAAREMDEKIARHDAGQTGDYNALMRLAGIGNGMGQAGSSSSSTVRAPNSQPSTAASALGGAMGGAAAGSAFGPWGTAIGGGLGLLGGWFG